MRLVDDYVKAVVECLDDTPLPRRYRKWAAVSSVAGALGRKVWLSRGFYWLRPNMYIILVGAPANGKTASASLPMIQVFKSLAAEPGMKEDNTDYNPNVVYYGLQGHPLTLLKDRITPESMGVELQRCGHQWMDLYGKTQTGGAFYDNSATLLTNEFGTFMEKDARYAQTLITELWDSLDDYQYKTKTAGTYTIKGPCLNWLACATPIELVNNLPNNARGQGLLSRLIIVYDPGRSLNEQLVYPGPNPDKINRLRETLADIALMKGPFVVHPTAEAKVSADIEAGLPPIPQDDNMQEYNGRRVSHLLKVAMCICASRTNTMMITEQDWEEAKEMLFDAEALMPVALKGFGMGKAGQTAVELEDFVKTVCRSNGKAGVNEKLLRKEILRKAASASEVDAMLGAMVSSGIIEKMGTTYRIPGGEAKKTQTTVEPAHS